MPAGVLDEFGAQAAGLDGVAVRWLTEPDRKAAFGRLIVDATEAVVADDQ